MEMIVADSPFSIETTRKGKTKRDRREGIRSPRSLFETEHCEWGKNLRLLEKKTASSRQ